jgi:hypothetical protein
MECGAGWQFAALCSGFTPPILEDTRRFYSYLSQYIAAGRSTRIYWPDPHELVKQKECQIIDGLHKKSKASSDDLAARKD